MPETGDLLANYAQLAGPDEMFDRSGTIRAKYAHLGACLARWSERDSWPVKRPPIWTNSTAA